MAIPKYLCPIENMSGAVCCKDHRFVVQTKRHQVGDGTTIEGRKEARYRNPRDYDKVPMRPKEIEQTNKLKKANRYIATWWNKDRDVMAQTPDYQYWYPRFVAQTKKAEPTAPIDKKTGLPYRYVDFLSFVRARYMLGDRLTSSSNVSRDSARPRNLVR